VVVVIGGLGTLEGPIIGTVGRLEEQKGFDVLLRSLLDVPESTLVVVGDGGERQALQTLARDLGYEVREENLVRTDLYNADECFFTGTAAEVTPIRELDGRTPLLIRGQGTGPGVARLVVDEGGSTAHGSSASSAEQRSPG
jgi:branched-chain amino acid aminotransferase